MNANPWRILGYEADMLFGLTLRLPAVAADYPTLVRYACAESAGLHLRIVVDILLSRGRENDIKLADLQPDFRSEALDKLRCEYGTQNTEDTPCWILNKMLAHASYDRRESYDYGPVLDKLVPLIQTVVWELLDASADFRAACEGPDDPHPP
jgi:hypothetical protein